MQRFYYMAAALILLASPAWSQTCDTGFTLEENGGLYNCRNAVCDAGENMYGSAVDAGQTPEPLLLTDRDGMPRPKIKDATGKWVGWTIGAYQCPPDPIGLHPNPDWPCGYDYCPQDGNKPNQPTGIRVQLANARPR